MSEKAIDLLEDALATSTVKESEPEILLRLGAALLAGDRAGEALAVFQAAGSRKAGKGSANLLADRALLGEGLARERQGDLDGALAVYSKLAARGEQDGLRAAARKAAIELARGKQAEAIELLRGPAAELEDAAERAAALFDLARAHASRGDGGRRSEILKEIVVQYPTTAAGLAALRLAQDGTADAGPLPDTCEQIFLEAPPAAAGAKPPAAAGAGTSPLAARDESFVEDIRALELKPTPYVPVATPDPKALLSFMVVDPEPEDLPVEPPRDGMIFLEEWK
jgi:tetratricopeptide (TPR) repeat protein